MAILYPAHSQSQMLNGKWAICWLDWVKKLAITLSLGPVAESKTPRIVPRNGSNFGRLSDF